MIAALYVDSRGPYVGIEGVDAWDVTRDARLYDGPHPVVAHPPCGPWSSLRHLCTSGDPSLAFDALDKVRRFGGVLEHPHTSRFMRDNTPRPGDPADSHGGVSIVVNQCDFGHPAKKRTRLYLVGCTDLPSLPPPRKPTHWCSGTHTPDQRGTTPPGIKVCSAEQRRRTPLAFRDFLLEIARRVRRPT